MSRTRRRAFISLDINDKLTNPKFFNDDRESWENGHTDHYSRRNSKYDYKPGNKSSSDFKKMMSKIRKAKERQAMKNKDYDNIPHFKRGNDWLYW